MTWRIKRKKVKGKKRRQKKRIVSERDRLKEREVIKGFTRPSEEKKKEKERKGERRGG